MNETITFTIELKVYEILAFGFLGGAMLCLIFGLIGYKFDLMRFIKDKM